MTEQQDPSGFNYRVKRNLVLAREGLEHLSHLGTQCRLLSFVSLSSRDSLFSTILNSYRSRLTESFQLTAPISIRLTYVLLFEPFHIIAIGRGWFCLQSLTLQDCLIKGRGFVKQQHL